MSSDIPTQAVVSFGPFEANLKTQELKKHGVRLRLPRQSFQILAILLRRPGQLVTREELQQTLWPTDTFVDFDKGINAAVNRLREALGDTADKPHFVETLPRRGYRFLASVSGAEEIRAGVPQPGRRRLWVPAAIGTILAVSCGIALWAVARPPVPKVLRFSQLTSDGQAKDGPLVSDGSRIYFNETLPGPRNVVAQVSIHGGETVPYAVPLKQPSVWDVSEDGTELLLANDEGNGHSLWLQSIAGGSPRQVGTVMAHDARFCPGTCVIYGKGGNIYSVQREGTDSRKLLDAGKVAFSFRYSPDEQVLRFSTFDVQRDDMLVMEAKADGSNLGRMFYGCCGRWTADGRYFVYQNRPEARVDLWAVRENRGLWPWKLQNRPVQITAGPLSFEEPLPAKDNKQVFAIGFSRRAELVRYDPPSGRFVTYLSGISAEGVAFSRDGQWVAYASFPDETLWRSKADGSERQQLTFPPLRVSSPLWSPDGGNIAFSGDLPSGVPKVYVISRQGGTPKQVLASEQSQVSPTWSPDGNVVVFGSLFIPQSPLYAVDLRTQSVTTLEGSNSRYWPRWSPDGKFIAALDITRGGKPKLSLFEVATKQWTELIGFPVDRPVWSHDGTYIYFKHRQSESEQAGRESVSRIRVSDRRIEKIADVENVGRVTTGRFVDWFGLTPDDHVLFGRDMSTQEVYALDMEWP